MGSITTSPPDITLKYGPMLIGVFINTILYGVLAMQVLNYHQTYKQDQWYIKALVFYLFVVETINTALDIGVMYEPLIVRYATEEAITNFPILFAAEPVTIGVISTPIQFFMAYRINRITKSRWIPLVISALGLVSLGGSIWTTIKIAQYKLFSSKPKLHEPALVWLLSAATADVLLTACLVTTLYKKKTGFKAMDSVLNRIIRLTVQTGMITATWAVADVVFFMALPHYTLNFIWDLSLTKIYANSFLSTLNARSALNGALHTGEPNFLWDEDTCISGSLSRSLGQTSYCTHPGRRETPFPTNYPFPSQREQEIELDTKRSYPPSMVGINVTVDRVVETSEADPVSKEYYNHSRDVSRRTITQ